MPPSFISLVLLCCISFSATLPRTEVQLKQTVITWVISSTLYKIRYNRQLQLLFLSIMFYKYSLRSPYRVESTVLCTLSLKRTRVAGCGTACLTQGRIFAIYMQRLNITYFSHDRVHTDDATGKVTTCFNSSLLH